MNPNKLYAYCLQIPPGKVTTYGYLAEALGKKGLARQVGQILSKNPYAPYVPCHRVIKSDGTIGGFFGKIGIESKEVKEKINMLSEEGVLFNGDKLDMSKYLFKDFKPIVGDVSKVDLDKMISQLYGE